MLPILTVLTTVFGNFTDQSTTSQSASPHHPIVQGAVYDFMNSNWANMALATTYTNFTNFLMIVYWGSIDWFVSVVADIDL